MRRSSLLIALAALALLLAAPALARDRYDVRVLAHVPPPGQPALAYVAPDRTIYVGTFTNSAGTANGASKVFAYSPSGQLVRTYTIQGQDPNADNGVQTAAMDANGTLYLLDQHPARVIALDTRTGAQSTYATFKDVPTCPPPGVGNECSATVADNPPEPDYAAWGPQGELYVTDYTQGLVWRVPPGGGAAHVWFTDPQLDGVQFGPAGIVMLPDRHTLMLDTSAGGATGPSPTTGKLYTLPINADGTPGTLHKLWESGPKEAPDGFALAQSGNVYMALVGPNTNQLVVIAPDGRELARISHDGSGGNGDVPFDEPSSVAFDGDRMIVTNDAYFSGDASHFVLFDVFAGEPGAPVYAPGGPTVVPPAQRGGGAARRRARVRVRPRHVHAGRRVRFRIHTSVRRGRIRFDGRRLRADRHGNLHVRLRLRHRRLYTLRVVDARGHTLARAHVRAR